MKTKEQMKRHAQKSIDLLRSGAIDGRDIMSFGLGTKGLYRDYFGEKFPFDAAHKAGVDVMTATLQAIIDDKPFELPQQ